MKRKFSKVLWHDIAAVTPSDDAGSWMSFDYIQDEAEKLFRREYTTVGKILLKNKEYIVIAATYDESDDSYSDVSMIPRSVIIKITSLDQ